MSEDIIEHDAWNYSRPKLPKANQIKLGSIHGVLPFDGVRNPGGRSNTAHRIWLTYRTAANNWQPKVGICESSSEMASGHEALIAPSTHDVRFQPLSVEFRDEETGHKRSYTHDLLITSANGHRTLVFVRNDESLSKPKTWREIEAIAAATPKESSDEMVVKDAADYTRQRRENLHRMHQFVFDKDDEADEIVLWTARRLKTLWLMCDLFPHAPIAQVRVFRACHRLIARGLMHANLDQVLWEHSRVEVVA